ncbi:hypothetical protein PAHAL_9G245100 [Panicum hallii]|uniref:Retrotransposon gag domain-containing protein n=1 Tax=Panicum hallii TaxID=206008 RepID=A0A2S3IM39_9POAL|nr:hypothetical protein PAHAL_9G245100 [Panicum hallii]
MTSSVEDLAKKFDGFDAILQKILDKVTGLESWRSNADVSMNALLTKADDAATCLQRLELAPPPPPPPPPQRHPASAPSPPSSAWVNPFDLNVATDPAAHPSASSAERPSEHHDDSGHRVTGGGILGSPPPHPVTGMCRPAPPRTFEFISDGDSRPGRSGPTPKLEFPKFDGQNPRLWKDRCELYFEVYSVSDALKPRFAALNFDGVATTWLQNFELKGRVRSWEALHTAVCARFDKD